MNSSYQEGYNSTDSKFPTDFREEPLRLTEEELRVLKECSNEAIRKRALPWSAALGITSYVGAKYKNILNHARFGAIPVVLTASTVGYLFGRVSYFSVCYERLMNIPGGTVNQRANRRNALANSSPYQSPVQDDRYEFIQSKPTDIEIPIMSNFDTVTNHLDNDTLQMSTEPIPSKNPKNYTTYDDLRERNRREYLEKMQRTENQTPPNHGSGFPSAQYGYSSTPEQPAYASQQPQYTRAQSEFQEINSTQGQSNYQRRAPVPVQPGGSEMAPTQDSGRNQRKVKTKYGDEWE